MLVKALTSFAGKVSMYAGEIREIADKEVAEDLIRVGYAIKYETDEKGEKPSKEEITPKPVETPVEVPEVPENPVEATEEEAAKALDTPAEEPKEEKKTSKKTK